MKYVVSILCLFSSFAVFADVYRWTDENGKVHFSDKKPKNAADVQAIGLKVPKPVDNPELERFREDNRKHLEALDKERNEEIEREQQQQKKIKQKKDYCKTLRREMKGIVKAGYLYRFDDQGNQMVYTDEQRQKYEKQLQERYRKFCK